MKLAELEKLIQNCTACPLHEHRTLAVPGEGNSNADLFFIGEGPGQKEDESGRPFVGTAGKFLEELLASIGLTRTDVFIGNIVKCRPPKNRDPFPAEVDVCTKKYLYQQIKLIRPKLIITLGRHAMRRFLPEDFTISVAHGKPYRRNEQIYYPVHHPAAALYHGALRDTLLSDFRRIPTVLKLIEQGKSSTSEL